MWLLLGVVLQDHIMAGSKLVLKLQSILPADIEGEGKVQAPHGCSGGKPYKCPQKKFPVALMTCMNMMQ